jgi:hypothetical protein
VAQRGEGGEPERHASEQIGSIGRVCHRRNEVGDRQLAPDLSTDAQITLTCRQRMAPAAKKSSLALLARPAAGRRDVVRTSGSRHYVKLMEKI